MLTKSQKIVSIVWVWSIAVLTALIVFQAVSIEFYVVLFLIGFFIIAGVFGPFHSRPIWKSWLNIGLVIGILLFGYIVLDKALVLVVK